MDHGFDVVIMRGLPRSGKTQFIRDVLHQQYNGSLLVCSADHAHMVDDGSGKMVYRFDPSLASWAHDQCLKKFMSGVDSRRSTELYRAVVVDNTNINGWEIAPYVRMAQISDFKPNVRIVRCHADFSTILKRTNDHAVPDGVLWAMWQNLHQERLPPFWKEEIVYTGD